MVRKVFIEESWHNLLKEEFAKPYFEKMRVFVRGEYKKKTIYPKGTDIFNAFNSTPVDKVKVVIIGQDPYHGENQAHGLCFSVLEGIDVPPSLKNIYKEIKSDLGIENSDSGHLQNWADQGVFLLNSVLTVEKGRANSHKKSGWEIFTESAVKRLSDRREGVVFFLWGKSAQEKELLIDREKHLILKAAHPSPLSAYNGFFGCKHFSQANRYLRNKNKKPINWDLS